MGMEETTIYSAEGYPIIVQEDDRGVPRYYVKGSNVYRSNIIRAVEDYERLTKF